MKLKTLTAIVALGLVTANGGCKYDEQFPNIGFVKDLALEEAERDEGHAVEIIDAVASSFAAHDPEKADQFQAIRDEMAAAAREMATPIAVEGIVDEIFDLAFVKTDVVS